MVFPIAGLTENHRQQISTPQQFDLDINDWAANVIFNKIFSIGICEGSTVSTYPCKRKNVFVVMMRIQP